MDKLYFRTGASVAENGIAARGEYCLSPRLLIMFLAHLANVTGGTKSLGELLKAVKPPRNDDPGSYQQQLICEAEEIRNAWHETKGGLSQGLKNALFESDLTLSDEILRTLITKPDRTSLAIAAGVAIMVLTRKVRSFKKKQQHGDPHQYLTSIVRKESEYLRMTFPLGLEP